jgi:signal transduction histidine kinase
MGQLAAGLAHELRNPLTAMRMLIEASRDQTGSAELDQRDLLVLDEEIARLEAFLQSFLDFARPPRLHKSTLDARLLVEQTLQLVAAQVRQRGAEIAYRQSDEPVFIEADPVQMRQVLLNLVLNALDAVGQGGEVQLAFSRQEAGQTSPDDLSVPASNSADDGRPDWVLCVSDNGPGVPDDMKDKIFQPFVSNKETGIGLGLAVCRRIVESHGGEITVDDRAGGGARFFVHLPGIEER